MEPEFWNTLYTDTDTDTHTKRTINVYAHAHAHRHCYARARAHNLSQKPFFIFLCLEIRGGSRDCWNNWANRLRLSMMKRLMEPVSHMC